MRVAFFLLLLCTLGSKTAAQSVTWLSSCSNKSFCLNNNSCTHGKVTLKEKAHSTCSNPGLFYSYQIDIGNNFSVDIKGNADSVSVDLPLGTHSIVWRATDNCLNVNTCSYLITVRDCVSPSLACINGLTQSLDEPFCMEEFSAEQFVLSVSDNCTPKNQLEYGLEITGTGTGFPKQSKLSFNQCDKGLNFVSVFVRDKSGLINTCNCYVLLQTNSGGCECNKAADLYPSGCIRTPYNRAVKPYTLAYRFESTAGISIPIVKPGLKVLKDSCYRDTISDLPFGADYKGTIEVSRKKDPLNGVTTYDLVLISRHILGLETFTSAYQVLAADVNKSGSVTSFDIVELRKLVLGVYDTLPNMPSWRFIQPLSKPSDILSFKTARDTYQIILPALNVDLELPDKHFIAVKMGDVNGTADPQLNTSQPREENPLVLKANGRRLNAGETAWIDIYPA